MPSFKNNFVRVRIADTPLTTVKGKFLARPESKEKYDVKKVVDILSSLVPLIDLDLYAVLIYAFNEKVIELASEGHQINTGLVHIRPVVTGTVDIISGRTTLKNIKLKVVALPSKTLRTSVAKTKLRVAKNQATGSQKHRSKTIYY